MEEDIPNIQTQHKFYERKYHSDVEFKCLEQANKQVIGKEDLDPGE
jgi:hypothetical protein